ncbi:hypothetical protein DEU56DRAFT_448941 [Suillus clintonianus]|uniref:uncharacterized protein n=1 Tax=Suillus clintonianus TaxID=1904413 RepID=UPI001B870120|nr:uncharacterized protein DEU56DRAFT_448941 [Suillus clintonianus]KAG2132094.1 hypothetical protein DEU56DRAFT_448941 [Suillus clintonianus]
MAGNAAGATAPMTPRHGVNSESKPNSTPLAVGSAAISEHIGAVGVDVEDVRPWITRDVENYKECAVDKMLEELLYRCKDNSKPLPDKSTLLDESLKAVLPICNEGSDAQFIKNQMVTLLASETEPPMYVPFIKAANCALGRLSELDAPGLVPSKAKDDLENIMFCLNDPSLIYQKYQGEQSSRKPDVVIVSNASAMKAGKCNIEGVYDSALKKPVKKFEWKELRTTLEFKHTEAKAEPPPATYAAKTTYSIPEGKKFMKYRREMDQGTDPDATPLPASGAATNSRQTSNTRAAATSSRQTSNARAAATSSRRTSNARSAATSSRQSSNAAGRSNQSQRTNNKGEKKRSSAGLADGGRKNKKPKRPPPKPHPVVQNGLYAAEMFAAHFARQSVISYLVENDIIYTWYFDRQGAIQCSGINFVQDLPRFMVLLLAMQRMPYAEWGYHTLRELETPGDIRVEDEKIGEVDLKFNLTSNKRTTHFGLRGRATTMFPVESKKLSRLVPNLPHHNPHNPTKELVAKLYWPEEARESEPDILKKVYKIAETDERVRYHVPEMVWFHKFEDTSTAKIRSALGLEDPKLGRRVFYIIIFRRLEPITDLSNKPFLVAWWHAVVCHYALWEGLVHHRDVSPSNLMVYQTSDGRWIGVLNDFDLSSTQAAPSGQERTGTVPFMSLGLLTEKAIQGQVKHLYQHDAESFIWVLTWVCICYDNGVFIGKGTKLNGWLTVDAEGCLGEKSKFLLSGRDDIEPSGSHRDTWEKMAQSCLDTVSLCYTVRASRRTSLENRVVFETWLEAKLIESKMLSRESLDVRV